MLYESTSPTHSPPSHHSWIKSGSQTWRCIFAVHQTGASVELGCNPSPNLQKIVDWTVKLPWCLQKSHKGEDQVCSPMACLKSAFFLMDLRAVPPSHHPDTNFLQEADPDNWSIATSLSFLKMGPSTLYLHLHIFLVHCFGKQKLLKIELSEQF